MSQVNGLEERKSEFQQRDFSFRFSSAFKVSCCKNAIIIISENFGLIACFLLRITILIIFPFSVFCSLVLYLITFSSLLPVRCVQYIHLPKSSFSLRLEIYKYDGNEKVKKCFRSVVI